MYRVDSGHRQCVLTAAAPGFNAVSFSPDGRALATAGYDDSVYLWEIHSSMGTSDEDTGLILKGHENWVWTVAFHPSGDLLASCSSV